MAKYRLKMLIDAWTWHEFLNLGRKSVQEHELVRNMAWSFKVGPWQVTHESDDCYLVPTPQNFSTRFTPTDMLLLLPDGNLAVCTQQEFDLHHEPHTQH